MSTNTALTVEERKKLRKFARDHETVGQQELQKWVHDQFQKRVSQSTISQSLSRKYESVDNPAKVVCKYEMRRRRAAFFEVENSVYQWLCESDDPLPLTGRLLATKASEFWDLIHGSGRPKPSFSNGWLDRFTSRYGICLRGLPGQTKNVGIEAINREAETIEQLAQEYGPADTYNCDETGLFFANTPSPSLSANNPAVRKRFTIHLCCNKDGSDKLMPWIIGKTAQPPCFGRVNLESLGCVWRGNGTAWTTVDIVKEWLHAFDRHVARPGRKVLLIMDNSNAHKEAVAYLEAQLALLNTKICLLSPRATSISQPMGHRIIRSFKELYHGKWLRYMLQIYDEGRDPFLEMDEHKAVACSVQAWHEVSRITIMNSWHHAGLSGAVLHIDFRDSARSDVFRVVSELLTRHSDKLGAISSVDIEIFLCPIEEDICESFQENLMERIAARNMPCIATNETKNETKNEKERGSESTESATVSPLPSPKEVLRSTEDVTSFIALLDADYSVLFTEFSQLEKKLHQGQRKQLEEASDTNVFASLD